MLGQKKKTKGKAGKDSRGRLQPRIDAIDAHAVDGGGSLGASMGAWAATSSSLGGQVAMRCDGRIEQSASYSWQLLSQRVLWLAWGRTNGWAGAGGFPNPATPTPAQVGVPPSELDSSRHLVRWAFQTNGLCLFFQHNVGSGHQSEWPQFPPLVFNSSPLSVLTENYRPSCGPQLGRPSTPCQDS